MEKQASSGGQWHSLLHKHLVLKPFRKKCNKYITGAVLIPQQLQLENRFRPTAAAHLNHRRLNERLFGERAASTSWFLFLESSFQSDRPSATQTKTFTAAMADALYIHSTLYFRARWIVYTHCDMHLASRQNRKSRLKAAQLWHFTAIEEEG